MRELDRYYYIQRFDRSLSLNLAYLNRPLTSSRYSGTVSKLKYKSPLIKSYEANGDNKETEKATFDALQFFLLFLLQSSYRSLVIQFSRVQIFSRIHMFHRVYEPVETFKTLITLVYYSIYSIPSNGAPRNDTRCNDEISLRVKG